jgi:ABC-type dipeptide/oligopeptide/nickel transport system permease component
VLGYLVRRVVLGALVVFAVGAISFLLTRVLRPELFGPEPLLRGTAGDLGRAFLHLDFGRACAWQGCPPVRELWRRGYAADLWLLGGAMAFGVGGGVAGGLWCAVRPGTRAARALESAATLAYCTPVYVVGLGLLLLFNSSFGLVPLPAFFDADPGSATL